MASSKRGPHLTTLSVQLLTWNDEATVGKAIRSAEPLGAEVLVADLGSTDATREVCRDLGARVVRTDPGPRDEIRNRLAARGSSDMVLTLEPWEAVVSGHPVIVSAAAVSRPTRLLVSQPALVTKPVRLWDRRTHRFRQPVFEAVHDDTAPLADALVFAKPKPPGAEERRLAAEWAAADPVSGQPEYCLAFCELAAGRHDEFLRLTDLFLFKAGQRAGMSGLSARHHRALVQTYERKNPQQALAELLVCVSACPLRAEYWCLLGDAFYHLARDFGRAAEMYRLALSLGRHRDQSDPWPAQLAMYDEYPAKMLASCEAAVREERTIRIGHARDAKYG